MSVLESFAGFEVGDTLTIRPDLMDCELGSKEFPVGLTTGMQKMAGMTDQIHKILNSYRIELEQDECRFLWEPGMFLDLSAPAIQVPESAFDDIFG